jgi:hypothetical protein
VIGIDESSRRDRVSDVGDGSIDEDGSIHTVSVHDEIEV